ncbi:MAG: hypothetical protein A3F83_09490 [Candidatus Glassbacteria bacterium RIFCSPLOWO2_12_FULL_58_11]|uniref:Uncharacterized protein n=2 Tax=Candidatus Glassiibacteriota TaxID=1817805 RepID=A0A1F5YY89_9BACT|nr:MAG: hypothetical protein A2Z86_06555 [Candidatus Glassbacteria bacterium GWA2_58_10]OGG05158.1 MAG: hypothetical protein A3F83_09490 [Candidatus Glassbacteria bacterium RIFCSPLOWO2_12_FULL_58_11]
MEKFQTFFPPVLQRLRCENFSYIKDCKTNKISLFSPDSQESPIIDLPVGTESAGFMDYLLRSAESCSLYYESSSPLGKVPAGLEREGSGAGFIEIAKNPCVLDSTWKGPAIQKSHPGSRRLAGYQ